MASNTRETTDAELTQVQTKATGPLLAPDLPLPREWVVQRLFGRNHWCTEWVSNLCKADPQFLWHMSQQASGYVHFICLVRLGILNGQREWAQMTLQQTGHALRTGRRRRVLEILFPEVGSRLFSILHKLGPGAATQDTYANLIRLLGSLPVAGILQFATEISPHLLRFLGDAEPDLAELRVWLDIDGPKALTRARYFHAVLKVIPVAANRKDLKVRLRDVKTLKQLQRWLHRGVMALEFPAAPWPGTKSLWPIRTGAELRAAALRFENCAFRHFDDILMDRCHIYVSEQGPIMYRIERDPLFGWRIDEKQGRKRARPLRKADRENLLAFGTAGIYCVGNLTEHHDLLLSRRAGDEENEP